MHEHLSHAIILLVLLSLAVLATEASAQNPPRYYAH